MKFIRIFIVLLILSGCGFKPLYYGDYKNDILSDFYCERITNDQKNPRATFFLNNELDRLFKENNKKEAKYLLKIEYNVDKDDYLIQDNSVANRKKIQVTLSYKVTEYKGDKILASGKLTDFDSFAITEFPYSDYATEEELIIRILLSLIQELRLQLLAKFLKET
ncbi:hypothetical protein [Rickettsiales endosymbiont of Trichoplax sp. H2]|uniref:hypothetical protein n=1 Tax=Rickettsiales endosymbiont of Trichoplax sp. H2 TaxID=2021221 RepID=UPI0012B3BD18|nr:hypothetical protein [Rickettsiales endosymbiont of Trichoplax sp. H2]MSO13268.1 Uncharacterized protein [Rickettsiales endosymbiont of Trichoplax sp. H2]